MTSRPTSTDRPARPSVDAKACTAFDLRTECEPMNAIFALREQATLDSLQAGTGIDRRGEADERADRLAGLVRTDRVADVGRRFVEAPKMTAPTTPGPTTSGPPLLPRRISARSSTTLWGWLPSP